MSVEARAVEERILDAAEQIANAVGIRKLRVDQVAADAGVSRQRVYTAYGDKVGLAQALCLRSFARVFDGCEAVVTAHGGPPADTLAECVRHVLVDAMKRPLLRLSLHGGTENSMVTLLTTPDSPLVTYWRTRILRIVETLWPERDAARLAVVADLATRSILSDLVCPTKSADETIRELATIVHMVMAAPD